MAGKNLTIAGVRFEIRTRSDQGSLDPACSALL